MLMWSSVTKRFFEYDATLTAKNGRPAITGSTHLFVSQDIPVVLKQEIPGLGRKGEIVFVKRGHARHHLIPNQLAVSGALWENILEFADPDLVASARIKNINKSAEVLTAKPFDWVNDVKLEFIRNANEEITVWDLLKLLSDQEQLDLLQSDLTFAPITKPGIHKVGIKLLFRGWTGNYTITVNFRDKQEVAEQEKKRLRDEQAKLKAKKVYKLGPAT